MGGYDDALVLLMCKIDQYSHNYLSVFFVQISCRLIRQNIGRVLYQCPRNGGALLLTAGDLADRSAYGISVQSQGG